MGGYMGKSVGFGRGTKVRRPPTRWGARISQGRAAGAGATDSAAAAAAASALLTGTPLSLAGAGPLGGARGCGSDFARVVGFGLCTTSQSATRAESPKRVSFPSVPRKD